MRQDVELRHAACAEPQADDDQERIEQPRDQLFSVGAAREGRKPADQETRREHAQQEQGVEHGASPAVGPGGLRTGRPRVAAAPQRKHDGKDGQRSRHGRRGEQEGGQPEGAGVPDHLCGAAYAEPHRRDHGAQQRHARRREPGAPREDGDRGDAREQEARAHRCQDRQDGERGVQPPTFPEGAGWRAGPAARSAGRSR